MIAWILAAIGIILLIIGFITMFWLWFVLAVASFVGSYLGFRRMTTATEETEEPLALSNFQFNQAAPVATVSAPATSGPSEPEISTAGKEEREISTAKEATSVEPPLETSAPPTTGAPPKMSTPPEKKPAGKKKGPEGNDSEEKIKKLEQLRDGGILTEEEFEQKKRQVTGDPDADEKISKLTQLRDAGILTEEEYEAKKSQITGSSA